MMHPKVEAVTNELRQRSESARTAFLRQTQWQVEAGKTRASLSCGNIAHAVAASCQQDKQQMLDMTTANVAIISAYNDMLSAHAPYAYYPDQIKAALQPLGHTAQVAGCVPAMCDGVTQGQPGMEMSLFSRDVIAQATAISLSHNVYDATLLLGVCDKIAPGQLMGALTYAHLPTLFVPSGPMPTGSTNEEKVAVRQAYAAGDIGKEALLAMECQAYHSQGTCTFYGTANTNQLVLEAMGLILPGAAFVAPNSALRQALTCYAATALASQCTGSATFRALADVVTEKSVINGVVALLASGGSTNHTIHLVAMARAAGIKLTWEDIDALSHVVPLLTRMYPNGPADINAFEAAGGVPTLMTHLHALGLLHADTLPAVGQFSDQLTTPRLDQGQLVWEAATPSTDTGVIAAPGSYFSSTSGLRMLSGNMGNAVIKVSAVDPAHRVVCAPARVFDCQHEVERAYQDGELNHDVVVVVRFNGPAANGMPELHKLMPILGNVQKMGYQVALVTDGRLSGASGKVPAALHVCPEAMHGGALASIQDGDLITLDANTGILTCDADFSQRPVAEPPQATNTWGRDWFAAARQQVSRADEGATYLIP
ncbi:phosphogluconate dehydratase [Salinivibrio kushneri]|uniref:Phosphogluconate dehydratase n=1 Tax=Salinivibrio kushneri TaxID=1908198 RepID=A0AB36K000_9GAMM|nr:phosphogluconate dehydratase [Salinivibrio kushneri]OOE40715.1 phosphogluconate dehydratase [Salinivibrio kushneri]OOE48541.1 phosphogluconate dehydratase [Salinivibrio kushneri]OOE49858.1 phosphogluconate dehydratase [Salinivibrio kushneri]OOE62936.1 phosphogluconate dehydratase [Salinivibrio kushneri]QCP03601.1 phosphogluconate dehydratase [Salinivibrio kushneri]